MVCMRCYGHIDVNIQCVLGGDQHAANTKHTLYKAHAGYDARARVAVRDMM